jgi:hypothetical protein
MSCNCSQEDTTEMYGGSVINQMQFVHPVYHPPAPNNHPKGTITNLKQRIPVTVMKTHYIDYTIPVLKVSAPKAQPDQTTTWSPSTASMFDGYSTFQ